MRNRFLATIAGALGILGLACSSGTEPIGRIVGIAIAPDSVALLRNQTTTLHAVLTVEGGRVRDTSVTWVTRDRGGIMGGSSASPNGLTVTAAGVVTLTGLNGGFVCARPVADTTLFACAAVSAK